MIVKLRSSDSRILAKFLDDTHSMPMPKKFRAALSRLRDDIKSQQVNSQRFEHAYPMVASVHSLLHARVGQILRWRHIAKWKKILFLPALLEWLFWIVPTSIRHRRRLNRVAGAFKRLRTSCQLGGQ